MVFEFAELRPDIHALLLGVSDRSNQFCAVLRFCLCHKSTGMLKTKCKPSRYRRAGGIPFPYFFYTTSTSVARCGPLAEFEPALIFAVLLRKIVLEKFMAGIVAIQSIPDTWVSAN